MPRRGSQRTCDPSPICAGCRIGVFLQRVILAVDQGTTGTTCLLVDEELNVRGRGYAELPQHFPRPGWVEHDPEEIWQSVQRAMHGLDGYEAIAITNA